MFHEIYTKYNNENEKAKDPLHLSRCIRLYPHDDNQGGFFVALFVRFEDEPDAEKEDLNNPWIKKKIK